MKAMFLRLCTLTLACVLSALAMTSCCCCLPEEAMSEIEDVIDDVLDELS